MSMKVPVENVAAQSKLNQEQAQAYNTILERVNSETPGLFFVDGPGGTRKTFLYRALLGKVRSEGMIALASATSGVAATILPGGRTTHSRFAIPLQADETTMTNMSKQVDRSFRDIMDSDIPFGGKVMVFGGDFRQVLPVVPKSTRAETVNASLVKSYLWPLIEKIQLSTNMRARADTSFSNFLLRVGNGEETTIKDNLIALPEQMNVQQTQHANPEETLISEIFPDLQQNYRSTDYITERAILASRNEFVDNLNEILIGKFPGEKKIYISFDSAEDDTNNYYQEEYLNTLTYTK
ncbi:uncharacterized protein LOC125853014 [Solanum stenotomum]|uniref:uncharacterized protein LOC125853014 n=1 Tax=Solanum stenotomum TaxID=172797 RepID=UPI0020D1661A|nr:uncharacterized protein LOC125853014 [Solanum stenotomum]